MWSGKHLPIQNIHFQAIQQFRPWLIIFISNCLLFALIVCFLCVHWKYLCNTKWMTHFITIVVVVVVRGDGGSERLFPDVFCCVWMNKLSSRSCSSNNIRVRQMTWNYKFEVCINKWENDCIQQKASRSLEFDNYSCVRENGNKELHITHQ